MTATTPRRRGPSTPVGGPAVSLTREYRLYRFFDADGVLLYEGITGRVPFKRLMEHVCEKPWAPEMARWELDPRVWMSEAEVLAAEKAAIIAERPRYNVAHNGNNPVRRVARPVPYRQPPTRNAAGPGVAARLLSSRRSWLVVAWIAAAITVWVAVDRVGVVLPTSWHLGVAAGLPLAVFLAVWRWWATRGRRRWRRTVRMFR